MRTSNKIKDSQCYLYITIEIKHYNKGANKQEYSFKVRVSS